MNRDSLDISNKVFDYITKLYGNIGAEKYSGYCSLEPQRYLRVNSLKTTPEKLQQILRERYNCISIISDTVPNTLLIEDKNNLTSIYPEHVLGDYYLQSLSSMIPPLILAPKAGERVLDICAAPGSKTTQLGELMNNKGTLIANEVAVDRIKILAYNLDRMNFTNHGVLNFKGEILSKYFNNWFDKILVDVPCSGLGIIQKKGEINRWWSIEKANNLSDLQYRLLLAALKMLKVGGKIVYSTCTLTLEENEFIIDKILKKFPVEVQDISLPIPSHNAFDKFGETQLDEQIKKGKRIIPWEVNSEGFFIIKLKKTGEIDSPIENKINFRFENKVEYISHREMENHFNQVNEMFGIEKDELKKFKYIKKSYDIFFVNDDWEENHLELFHRIGTKFGQIEKRGNLIFHTNAAQIFQKEIKKSIIEFDSVEQIKKYISGSTIRTDKYKRGQYVVKYKDNFWGTAIVTEEGIKSRYPRSRRTQNILLDF
ncbi:MAG: hypothetical protein C0425_03725 [Chlorobiaceae bacterium]|nr:hypothetical protein [Chlorobiaceae bacterium]MBA4309424.1 hypothetical protein [Chlorobiaceae bacterium]